MSSPDWAATQPQEDEFSSSELSVSSSTKQQKTITPNDNENVWDSSTDEDEMINSTGGPSQDPNDTSLFQSPSQGDFVRTTTRSSIISVNYGGSDSEIDALFTQPQGDDEEEGNKSMMDADSESSQSDINGSESESITQSQSSPKPRRRKTKSIPSSQTSETKSKKSSKKAPKAQPMSVVDSELEAMRLLSAEPTKAELERRALVELDADELEDRLDRMKQAVRRVVCKATGLTEQQQKLALKAAREYLKPLIAAAIAGDALLEKEELIDSKELAEAEAAVDIGNFIERCLERQERRLYGDDNEPRVSAFAYLQRETYDDSELENESVPIDDAMTIIPETKELSKDKDGGDDDDMIMLSDSDDDSPPVVVSSEPTSLNANRSGQFLHNLHSRGKPKSSTPSASATSDKLSRTALLISLRKQVASTALANYCSAKNIRSDQFGPRLEIAETCRRLVELLRDTSFAADVAASAARRAAYNAAASDSDEEFDGTYETGQYLTEAEKLVLLQEFANGSDEEDVEEEEDPEEVLAALHNEIAESEATAIEALQDTLAVMGDTIHDGVDDGEKIGGVDDNEKSTEVVDSDEENNSARRVPKKLFGRANRARQINLEPNSPAATTGSPTQPVENIDDNVDVDDEDSAETQPADGEVQPKKTSRPKTGNALFRLQLEAEERQLSKASKRKLLAGGVFEDEAAEESDEDAAAGLGDFGFSLGRDANKQAAQEAAEERAALRLRAGDLDHIVDDLSEGEGDEEAGARARADLEWKEDREKTRQLITAVTEGRDAALARHKKQKRSGFSFDSLVSGEVRGVGARARGNNDDNNEEGNASDEDFDEEELLQRGMSAKLERQKRAAAIRMTRGLGEDDTDEDAEDDSDSDDSVVGASADLEKHLEATAETMDREERLRELERLSRMKEREHVDALRRRQLKREYRMRREQSLLAAQASAAAQAAAAATVSGKSASAAAVAAAQIISPELSTAGGYRLSKNRTLLAASSGTTNFTRTHTIETASSTSITKTFLTRTVSATTSSAAAVGITSGLKRNFSSLLGSNASNDNSKKPTINRLGSVGGASLGLYSVISTSASVAAAAAEEANASAATSKQLKTSGGAFFSRLGASKGTNGVRPKTDNGSKK